MDIIHLAWYGQDPVVTQVLYRTCVYDDVRVEVRTQRARQQRGRRTELHCVIQLPS